MERHEAATILKRLLRLDLVRPSLVSIELNKHGKYNLEIKGDYDKQAITEFLKENKLAMKEDTEKGICLIYKP